MKITKLLIVDDSRIFRSAVEGSLRDENDIEVIGSVRNGIKAIEFIQSTRPDIVTLDVEMPEMDGLETLDEIRRINESDRSKPPIGVIMISSLTEKGADTTIKALEAGAFDFITKPEVNNSENGISVLRRRLVPKIRFFATKMINSGSEKKEYRPEVEKSETSHSAPQAQYKAVLIGVSTGGPKALMSMLPDLCGKTDLPILIVQHMPPKFTASLAESLNPKCSHFVAEGTDNEVIMPGKVYIAPGGRHMLLRRSGGRVKAVINDQPPEKNYRPSVNVLFRSALSAYNGNVISIILTGMGDDGTRGVAALKRAGAYVIAQDDASSVVWGMPGSAVKSGNVDRVLPLGEIPDFVEGIVTK